MIIRKTGRVLGISLHSRLPFDLTVLYLHLTASSISLARVRPAIVLVGILQVSIDVIILQKRWPLLSLIRRTRRLLHPLLNLVPRYLPRFPSLHSRSRISPGVIPAAEIRSARPHETRRKRIRPAPPSDRAFPPCTTLVRHLSAA